MRSARYRTSATSARLLWDRRAEWQRRLELTREARASVCVSTYFLSCDRYGQAFLEELRAALARGVAVTLVVDRFGQRLSSNLMTARELGMLLDVLARLERAGARIRRYRPPGFLARRTGGGQHIKIQAADGACAIFGSSNISRHSFEQWNELSVELRGPVVKHLVATVGELIGEAPAARQPAADGEVPLDYFVCDPCAPDAAGDNLITDELVRRLDVARNDVRLTSFFFKPVAPLLDALLRARRRGVRVVVHHSAAGALEVSYLPWLPAAMLYERLLAAGVEVFENGRGEHSKLVVVDGAWAMFGSYNLEHAAHMRLAEAMLATEHPPLVAELSSILDARERDGDNRRLHTASLHAWPARLRLERWLYRPLRRFI